MNFMSYLLVYQKINYDILILKSINIKKSYYLKEIFKKITSKNYFFENFIKKRIFSKKIIKKEKR